MPLDYDTPLFRPPAEGDSLIIQATLGCSFNQCSFCSMYRTKQYRERPLQQVFSDIREAARRYPHARRVFLADGDALALPATTLAAILQELARNLPQLARVSCYATPSNILHKSSEELALLRRHKLGLLYLGIESGADSVLRKITKGATRRGIMEAMIRADAGKIKLSGTLILGLGGRRHWQEHIDGTIALLNQAPLTYLSTLQLFLHETAVDEFHHKFGEPFEPQEDTGMLLELQRLINGLQPPRPLIFRSNHASNALTLAGNLPRDRDRLLTRIQHALHGIVPLRPEYMRGI